MNDLSCSEGPEPRWFSAANSCGSNRHVGFTRKRECRARLHSITRWARDGNAKSVKRCKGSERMSEAPRVSAWCREDRRRRKVDVRSTSPDEFVAEHRMPALRFDFERFVLNDFPLLGD